MFNEIPGADYSSESIGTPNEYGFDDSSLEPHRVFISSEDVPAGSYQIKVTAVSNGPYYLESRSFDANGTTNASGFKVGALSTGSSNTIAISHTTIPAPIPNGTIELSRYNIKKDKKKGFAAAEVYLAGKIRPYSGSSVLLNSSLRIQLGKLGGYSLLIPAPSSHKIKLGKTYSYTYAKKGVFVELLSNGNIIVKLENVNLTNIASDELGFTRFVVDSIDSQLNSDLICDKNTCDLDDDYHDHHDHGRNKCKYRHLHFDAILDLLIRGR